VRRDELARLGVQLPVLPTIVLGGLPGPPEWALRLERIGLDVVASGSAPDTVETWRPARQAVPHRPVKAVAGDMTSLVAAGCVIVEGGGRTGGAYGLDARDGVIAAVEGTSPEVDDPDEVAHRIVAATDDLEPAMAWAAATPGLDTLAEDVVEAKLAALVEGVRRARLYLVKRQFEI
jgi:hypothetical protein